MKIIQSVFCSGPFGRFSELLVQGRTFYSVERPWKDNQPFESSVPLGEYRLVWRPTTTHVPQQFDGHTWYMVGDTVGLEQGDKHRWGCAWHIGNTDRDVQGCLAPGIGLGSIQWRDEMRPRWGVTRSGHAMLDLLQLLGPQDHELSINIKVMG